MDGIFAGQILGEKAMTAVGIATPFTYINTGIATLIGVGSASLLSRAIGEGNQRTIDKVMGNLCFWVLLLSTIVTILGYLFCGQLLMIFGAKGELLDLSTRYLRIIFLGSIFVNFAQAANMVMRSEGLMKRAMLIMSLGAGINIVLDPVLMIMFREHGVEGAAIATITAQFIRDILDLPVHHVKILDGIKVDYYGTLTPLSSVATITTPDAKTISIQPREENLIPVIEKAILASDVGITPANNGEVVRLSIPPLTEERRKQLVKQAGSAVEEAKISIRNARRDTNELIKKSIKADNTPEDVAKDAEADVQKLHDRYIKRVDELFAAKEKEIMTV